MIFSQQKYKKSLIINVKGLFLVGKMIEEKSNIIIKRIYVVFFRKLKFLTGEYKVINLYFKKSESISYVFFIFI